MEWKEAGKWFVVIVGAGVAGELLMMLVNRSVTAKAEAVARETAQVEVERLVATAVQRMQTQNLQIKTNQAPPLMIANQKDAYPIQI